MFQFRVITGPTVLQLLAENPARSIKSVQETYLKSHDGLTVNPPSHFLRFPEDDSNRIIALLASIQDPSEGGNAGVSGMKWIASYPKNIHQQIPRASAVLVLNDYQTGYPYAMLEGAQISAVRTAASAVLGAHWLNGQRKQVKSVSFIGAGVIARNIFEMFLLDGWQFEEVTVYDKHSPSMQPFGEFIASKGITRVTCSETIEPALTSDIVVFATSDGTPYVTGADTFRPGQVVLNISLRDLGPDVILGAYNIVDDIDHCLKANTSPHLAEQAVGNRDFVTGTIAGVISGEVELGTDRPIIYSPFGMGILDLALGKDIHDEAVQRGMCHEIPNFFGETKRW